MLRVAQVIIVGVLQRCAFPTAFMCHLETCDFSMLAGVGLLTGLCHTFR